MRRFPTHLVIVVALTGVIVAAIFQIGRIFGGAAASAATATELEPFLQESEPL